jgi:DNA-directed RNA polymerase subunit L/DNA-directed RNA polymerase alpha subunit
MEFDNLKRIDNRTLGFTLKNTHVSYANTLRRLVLTGVETVSFRADMTSTGTTTDVVVKKNDTPMTNEMLAHRFGLLPINVTEPLKWNPDRYSFKLQMNSLKDDTLYVKSGDIKVYEIVENEDEPVEIDSMQFFPPNPLTRDTCLIATLQPGSGTAEQHIEIMAKATVGTGRENARFIPVSQCSYEYTRDEDPARRLELFQKWLVQTKMITETLDKASEKYQAFEREFNTMEVARCYLVDDKGEPYSFDFTVESAGVLPVPYIVQRACEVGENMCTRYVNIDKGELPKEMSISSAKSRIIGYDFLISGHDHTLGNLLQTYLVENHINGVAEPKITYAGYSVPHPLRDEFVLRIGVEDGDENTAKLAVANASKGCVSMFRKMREEWMKINGVAPPASTGVKQVGVSVRRKTPKMSPVKLG